MKTTAWHRLRMLWRVWRAWNRSPYMRLGQLVENHCPWHARGPVPLYYVRDADLASELERSTGGAA